MNTQIALNKRLFDAVSDGDLELLNRCLAEGADVNAPDPSSGYVPLAMAAHMGHQDVLRCLIQNGAAMAHVAQLEAVNFGYADVLSILLEAGANPNWKEPDTGETPLHVATFRGQREGATECVRRLLAAGADPNVHTKNRVGSATYDGTYVVGETPLHWAAAFGSQEMIRLLIDAGADILALDADGHTPRHYLAHHQRGNEPHLVLSRDAFCEIIRWLPNIDLDAED